MNHIAPRRVLKLLQRNRNNYQHLDNGSNIDVKNDNTEYNIYEY